MWPIEPQHGMPGVIVDGMDVVAVYEADELLSLGLETAKAHQ